MFLPTLNVFDRRGRRVAAKALLDKWGDAIISPNTGAPMIAPISYDAARAIEYGLQLRARSCLSTNVSKFAQVAYTLLFDFWHGGPQDLQRSYNGMVGGKGEEFVLAFQDSAAFNLGLIATAAGLRPRPVISAAGIYNYFFGGTNTNGAWWNHPNNVKSIIAGIECFNSGRFGFQNAISTNSDPARDVPYPRAQDAHSLPRNGSRAAARYFRLPIKVKLDSN